MRPLNLACACPCSKTKQVVGLGLLVMLMILLPIPAMVNIAMRCSSVESSMQRVVLRKVRLCSLRREHVPNPGQQDIEVYVITHFNFSVGFRQESCHVKPELLGGKGRLLLRLGLQCDDAMRDLLIHRLLKGTP